LELIFLAQEFNGRFFYKNILRSVFKKP
jgi:hypothetical protein